MEPKWRGDEGRVDGRWRGTGGMGIAAGTASSSRGKIDGEMLVRSVVAVNTAVAVQLMSDVVSVYLISV